MQTLANLQTNWVCTLRIITKCLLSVDPTVAIVVLPYVWPIGMQINGSHFLEKCRPNALSVNVGYAL